MGKPLYSINFAFVFSLSLAASYTTNALSFRKSSSSPAFTPRATTTDLLLLLGPPKQASSVNSQVALELRSCFKFIVPFSPCQPGIGPIPSRSHRKLGSRSTGWKEENDMIWWPPAPVMELARIAVDSGGDPGAIHRTLDPTVIPVPDVEGSNEDRCELTRTPYGRCFINEELNSYFKFLFQIIVARGPSVGLNVSLTRFDFFHGHLFLAKDSARLGILFHAKEYPACDKELFPYNMGYCQIGSNVTYDDSMNLRNILWLAPLPSNSTKEWLAPGILYNCLWALKFVVCRDGKLYVLTRIVLRFLTECCFSKFKSFPEPTCICTFVVHRHEAQ